MTTREEIIVEINSPTLTADIFRAIYDQKETVIIAPDYDLTQIKKTIRRIMREFPEIFWFSHQYSFDEKNRRLRFKYNFSKTKRQFYEVQINNAIKYLFEPNALKYKSDLEKVAYVYSWMEQNTNYDIYSSFNQTVYSVLINRKSVCTGYAKTAQLLLRELGIESHLVFGKFNADKSIEGRHGWNIVKIDGKWYHVDFSMAHITMANLLTPGEMPKIINGLLWNYFCVSDTTILRNRTIEYPESFPKCDNDLDEIVDTELRLPIKQLAVCKSNSGSTSSVYLDSYNKDNVIKVVQTNKAIPGFEVEILLMLKGCKHNVKLKNIEGDKLILEQLIPWAEMLKSHYYNVNEKYLAEILIELTEGLKEFKEKGIIYYDIHYNNIYMSGTGNFKWGDFGLAFRLTRDSILPSSNIGEDGIPLGSRWFIAPETFTRRIYTESSAIYSMAMLAYFVLNDMLPPFWNGCHHLNKAISQLIERKPIGYPKFATKFPRLSRLVCEILNSKVKNRLKTFEDFISELRYIIIEDDNCILMDSVISLDSESEGITLDNDTDIIESDIFVQTMGVRISSDFHDENFVVCDNPPSIQRAPSVDSDGPEDVWCDADTFATTMQPLRRSVDVREMPKETYIPSLKSTRLSGPEKTARSTCNPQSANWLTRLFKKKKDGKKLGKESTVNTCVFAPAAVERQKSFLVRIYFYLAQEEIEVIKKMKDIDPTAVRKEYKPLDLPVKTGDVLSVQLKGDSGVEISEPVKKIIWSNHFADCTFRVKPIGNLNDMIEFTAILFVNGIPAGEMLFNVDIMTKVTNDVYARVEPRNYSKIFISYAHEDEKKVRGIAQGCRMLGKDYFFDRHTLEPGDIYRNKIFEYIKRADLFVLCWSKNAANSEWVQIEKDYALQQIAEGNTQLIIYPLSINPEAPLPKNMIEIYNFGKL